MGMFFTLLYIFTAYLAPATVFGDLAAYHLEIIIAVLALLTSLPGASGSSLLKMSQTYAVIALVFSVIVSLIFVGAKAGVPGAVIEFSADYIVYFLILWNVRTRLHLQMVIAVILLAAIFMVYRGASAVWTQSQDGPGC